MARILIVDDDRQVRAVFRRALEEVKHVVAEASNGNQAAELYRQEPPGLVITDIIMPEREGLETIKDLRGNFPEVKIIAISGGGWMEATDCLALAKGLGANLALTKPIDLDDLVKAVDTLIGQSAQ